MPDAHPCVLCLPCGVSKSYNPNPKRLLYRPPLKNAPNSLQERRLAECNVSAKMRLKK